MNYEIESNAKIESNCKIDFLEMTKLIFYYPLFTLDNLSDTLLTYSVTVEKNPIKMYGIITVFTCRSLSNGP